MKKLHYPFFLLAFMAAFSVASAVPINVPNYSFETPVINPGTETATVPNWTVNSTVGGAYIRTQHPATPLPGQLGQQYLFLRLPGATASAPQVSLTALSAAPISIFEANTIYTLTISLAVNTRDNNKFLGFGLYDAVSSNLITSNRLSFMDLSVGNSFQDFNLTLDTSLLENQSLVGSSFKIGLFADTTTANGRNVYFDNVRLDAAVIPEPSTWGLIGLSLGALALLRRRLSRVS